MVDLNHGSWILQDTFSEVQCHLLLSLVSYYVLCYLMYYNDHYFLAALFCFGLVKCRAHK